MSESPPQHVGAALACGLMRLLRDSRCRNMGLFYPSRRPASRPKRLILFARWPMPGKTKTRLIPALGPLGAAELQRRMTRGAVDTARAWAASSQREIEVRHEGGSWRQMRRWLGSRICYRRQARGDLGHRMAKAFGTAFHEGARRVVLIGTDCHDATSSLLDDATSALHEHDLVLGPTRDGGYWLIGMKRPLAVFDGVPWSTDSVLARTLELAGRQGLSVHLLPKLSDIDTPDDLRHAGDLPEPKRPVISVVIPTRNEANNIEATIRSASVSGVEIIVADGSSTDGTGEQATALGAQVIQSPLGRARQQNAGAAVAQADILLFLHADTILPAGWPRDVFESLLDPSVVGGGFLWKTDLDNLYLRLARFVVRLRTVYGREPWGDQAVFVRRGDFEAIGGYPDVPIAEDWDFVRALRRRGRIVAVPKPVLTSARRWQRIGVVRGFLTNRLIILGCQLGLPRNWLLRLY